MHSLNEKQIESLTNLLLEESKRTTPWILRKEISAWAGIVLFFAGMWSLITWMPDQGENGIVYIIIFVLFIILLPLAFFSFVQSQYASIHWQKAYSEALLKVITGIIVSGNKFFENCLSIEKDLWIHIHSLSKKLFESNQQFRGKLYPIRISLQLWFDLWRQIILRKKKKLNTKEKEEAAIYNILFLGWLISVFMIITKITWNSNDSSFIDIVNYLIKRIF